MGTNAFKDFLTSISNHISELNAAVVAWEEHIAMLKVKPEGGCLDSASDEAACQGELDKTRTAVEELEKFFMTVQEQWTQPKDRVIGHVMWAPPISVSSTPYGYTKDVCVVKLDGKKFLQNFMGNVLDLGVC